MDSRKLFPNKVPKPRRINIWQEVEIQEKDDEEGQTSSEDAALLDIGVSIFDQHKLEQGVMNQIDEAFKKREQVLEQKRATREIKQVEMEIREVKSSIAQACRVVEVVSSQRSDKETKKRLESINCQKLNKEKQLKTLQAKLKRLQKVAGIPVDASLPDDEPSTSDIDKASSSAMRWALGGGEADAREELIKSGQMTPFGSMAEDSNQQLAAKQKTQKKKLFLDDGFNDFLTSQSKPKKKEEPKNKQKITENKNFKIPKKKTSFLKAWIDDSNGNCESTNITNKQLDTTLTAAKSIAENGGGSAGGASDEEYVPDMEEEARNVAVEEEEEEQLMSEGKFAGWKKPKKPRYDPESDVAVFDDVEEGKDALCGRKVKLARGTKTILDDGKLKNYQKRLQKYKQRLNEEFSLGVDVPADKELNGGLKVPGRVWSKLYKYQRTGVRWLWELHTQNVGGILGDEMGLGKTIQVISFLAALQQSGVRSRGVPGHGYDGLGPVLIIVPTTVMHQWVRELHTWWPPLRAAILHDSGTYEGSRAQLVDNIVTSNGILITSYERARINIEMLLDHGWHYVILDEGHKIRNPDAAVTTALKLFRTPHRIILSGSPVQNNLRELWSLFDFIFPGKLGTLPVFMEQFSVPIVQGGYSNATEVQVHTAYKCACKLRDTISPYLLRRMKRDVQTSLHLPAKNEQVLFCRLSDYQVEVYQRYLDSDAVHSILCREMKVFAGLIQLRKICNHPDLYTGGPKLMVGEPVPTADDQKSYGYYKRSGKMLVIASLLKIWKKQGHKVLLFSQSKAMVDILESFAKSRGYTYTMLHGGTPVQSRQALIKRFNEDKSIFVFLLTTRVGGLGVNLTGANRVVIYDPDWNPSTDSQAQERAWRIGQQRDVTIYRLLTSGTIEEKIYHRQIFKQFLTNRILKDPWQRRFFKSNDLHELFILKDHTDSEGRKQSNDPKEKCTTETAAIFAGIGSEVHPDSRLKNRMRREREKEAANSNFVHSLASRRQAGEKKKREKKNKIAVIHTGTDAGDDNAIDGTQNSTTKLLTANEPQMQPKLPHFEQSNSESTSMAVHPDEITAAAADWDKNPMDVARSEDGTGPNLGEQNGPDHDIFTNEAALTMVCSTGCDVELGVRSTSPTNPKDEEFKKNYGANDTKSSSTVLKESLMRARLKFQERKRTEEPDKVRKKRRKKQPVVDGEVVSNVAAIEDFKGAKESTKEVEKKGRKATDDYVLERLFKRAGVHSALQHNTIMDSAHPDFALVEVEAERVAKESVRNLRLSRREYQFPQGRQSPNETKLRFGKKTKPSKEVEKDDCAILRVNKIKDNLFKASHLKKILDGDDSKDDDQDSSGGAAPLSASQLLSSMRRRNHEEIHKQEELDVALAEEESELFGFNISQAAGGPSGQVQNPTEHDDLMTELRNFIAFQCEVDGQAKTSEIMEEFGSKVKPEHAAIFKSILKQLCTSQHLPGLSENVWTLKAEFR